MGCSNCLPFTNDANCFLHLRMWPYSPCVPSTTLFNQPLSPGFPPQCPFNYLIFSLLIACTKFSDFSHYAKYSTHYDNKNSYIIIINNHRLYHYKRTCITLASTGSVPMYFRKNSFRSIRVGSTDRFFIAFIDKTSVQLERLIVRL